MRRQSAFARYLGGLEAEAMEEARLALREYAPSMEQVITAREFSLITGSGGLGLNRYEAAWTAAAMTLMVYARRIVHVEQGVGT